MPEEKSPHNNIRVSKEAIRANEEKLKKKPGFNQMAQKMVENLNLNSLKDVSN